MIYALSQHQTQRMSKKKSLSALVRLPQSGALASKFNVNILRIDIALIAELLERRPAIRHKPSQQLDSEIFC